MPINSCLSGERQLDCTDCAGRLLPEQRLSGLDQSVRVRPSAGATTCARARGSRANSLRAAEGQQGGGLNVQCARQHGEQHLSHPLGIRYNTPMCVSMGAWVLAETSQRGDPCCTAAIRSMVGGLPHVRHIGAVIRAQRHLLRRLQARIHARGPHPAPNQWRHL